MGCGQSNLHNNDTLIAKSLKKSKNSSELRDAKDIPGQTPKSAFEAGYLMADNPGGPVATYEDYRGYEVTTTNSMSKNKTDKICVWADDALAAKKSRGDVLFNPQNPAAWPRELITAYDAAALFANHHSVAQCDEKREQDGLKEDQRPGMTRVY